MPTQMVNRWKDRVEPSADSGTVYWHVLLGNDANARATVERAQERLAKFPGLHLTPLKWLHMTTLIVGSTIDITRDQQNLMLVEASRLLQNTEPIGVRLRRISYSSQGIVLGVQPSEAVAPVLRAAEEATKLVTGREGRAGETDAWVPHVTICYSTQDQPTEPIIASLGRELPECAVTIDKLSLVVQWGPEREWSWEVIGTAGIGSPRSPRS
jgi:2'-5' RNA ligase